MNNSRYATSGRAPGLSIVSQETGEVDMRFAAKVMVRDSPVFTKSLSRENHEVEKLGLVHVPGDPDESWIEFREGRFTAHYVVWPGGTIDQLERTHRAVRFALVGKADRLNGCRYITIALLNGEPLQIKRGPVGQYCPMLDPDNEEATSPWPKLQLYALVNLCVALRWEFGLDVGAIVGHEGMCPRKPNGWNDCLFPWNHFSNLLTDKWRVPHMLQLEPGTKSVPGALIIAPETDKERDKRRGAFD
jgi:N-acetyl-anhydromuramyl-L-alanine amidase AmpD